MDCFRVSKKTTGLNCIITSGLKASMGCRIRIFMNTINNYPLSINVSKKSILVKMYNYKELAVKLVWTASVFPSKI